MASWTAPKTWNVGDVLTASDMDTYVRDNTTFASSATGTLVQTSQSLTGASYADLATVGPAITITTGANALVTVGALVVGVSGGSSMAFAISGATTAAANDLNALLSVSVEFQAAMTTVVQGLTPGTNTFTAKYKSDGTHSSTWANRWLSVIPLP